MIKRTRHKDFRKRNIKKPIDKQSNKNILFFLLFLIFHF